MENTQNLPDYIVYTDGGCAINPGGHGAYAAIIIHTDTGEIEEYPEEYCCIGIYDDELNEDRNGDLGCNLHWKTINHLICKENEIPQEPWCMPKGTE